MRSILVAVALLACGVIAEAQQAKKFHRIGYLAFSDPASDSASAEAIRKELRAQGYIEGQNLAIEYRYAEGKVDRFSELAAELVRLKVDVIVASGGTRLVRAVMNTTKTIPIVMAGAGVDAVEAGFGGSLALDRKVV